MPSSQSPSSIVGNRAQCTAHRVGISRAVVHAVITFSRVSGRTNTGGRMHGNVRRSRGAQICRRLIPILLIAVAMTAEEVPIAPVVEGAAVLSQYAESGASDG